MWLIVVNIWSHLLGAVGFGLLAGYASFTFLQRYPTSSPTDIAVFACFFGGAVTCLGMSASVNTLRSLLILVPHDPGTFTNSLEFRIEIGLLGDHNFDYWVLFSECLLRILLFPALAKILLVDGILPNVSPAEIDYWTGDIVDLSYS
jgi:hypothetical protein